MDIDLKQDIGRLVLYSGDLASNPFADLLGDGLEDDFGSLSGLRPLPPKSPLLSMDEDVEAGFGRLGTPRQGSLSLISVQIPHSPLSQALQESSVLGKHQRADSFNLTGGPAGGPVGIGMDTGAAAGLFTNAVSATGEFLATGLQKLRANLPWGASPDDQHPHQHLHHIQVARAQGGASPASHAQQKSSSASSSLAFAHTHKGTASPSPQASQGSGFGRPASPQHRGQYNANVAHVGQDRSATGAIAQVQAQASHGSSTSLKGRKRAATAALDHKQEEAEQMDDVGKSLGMGVGEGRGGPGWDGRSTYNENGLGQYKDEGKATGNTQLMPGDRKKRSGWGQAVQVGAGRIARGGLRQSGGTATSLELLLKSKGDPTTINQSAGAGSSSGGPGGVEPAQDQPVAPAEQGKKGSLKMQRVTNAQDVGQGVPAQPVVQGSREEALMAQLQQQARQVDNLIAENAALRAHLRAMEGGAAYGANAGAGSIPEKETEKGESHAPFAYFAQTKTEEDRQTQLGRLKSMVQERATDMELQKAIAAYKDMWGDFGSERWNALRWHLRSLKASLMPNQITRMVMWSIEMNDGSASAPGPGQGTADESPGSVWHRIITACEMSPGQARLIQSLNSGIGTARKDFADMLSLLRGLEEKVARNFEGLELIMAALMSILSPRQMALFLQWQEANNHLFNVLPSLAAWPGRPAGVGESTSTTGTGGAGPGHGSSFGPPGSSVTASPQAANGSGSVWPSGTHSLAQIFPAVYNAVLGSLHMGTAARPPALESAPLVAPGGKAGSGSGPDTSRSSRQSRRGATSSTANFTSSAGTGSGSLQAGHASVGSALGSNAHDGPRKMAETRGRGGSSTPTSIGMRSVMGDRDSVSTTGNDPPVC